METLLSQVEEALAKAFRTFHGAPLEADSPLGGFVNGIWRETLVDEYGDEVDILTRTRVNSPYGPTFQKGVGAELLANTPGMDSGGWRFPERFKAVNHHLLLTFELDRDLQRGDPVGIVKHMGIITDVDEHRLCTIRKSDGTNTVRSMGDVKFMPPLLEVSEVCDDSFYCPWKFAAMLMFSEHEVCTANFSSTLKMVVVGGYTEPQVLSSALHFVTRIQTACLRLWGAPLKLVHTDFNNVLFCNKIPGHSIRVDDLWDLAKRMGWSYRYAAHQINKMFLNPFPKTKPSLTCTIVPTGGVNITGARTVNEQLAGQAFLERFLGHYLSADEGFD